MAWLTRESHNDPGFTMICHGNRLHALMSFLMPGLMMEEEAEEEGTEVMEATGRAPLIHLVVYHPICPYKAVNCCLTLLGHPCKLQIYQIQDITSFKKKGYNYLQSPLGFLHNWDTALVVACTLEPSIVLEKLAL